MVRLGDGYLNWRRLKAAMGSRGPWGAGREGRVHREQGTFRVSERTGDGREDTRSKGSMEQRSASRDVARQRLLGCQKTACSSLFPALPTTGLCFYFSRVGLLPGGWERRAVGPGRLRSRLEAASPPLQLWPVLEVSEEAALLSFSLLIYPFALPQPFRSSWSTSHPGGRTAVDAWTRKPLPPAPPGLLCSEHRHRALAPPGWPAFSLASPLQPLGEQPGRGGSQPDPRRYPPPRGLLVRFSGGS